MITMLKDWPGTVEINGKQYNTIQDAISDFGAITGVINIKLYPKQIKAPTNEIKRMQAEAVDEKTGEYRITVKKYMTEPASPQFDFMEKWNNNNPMPMRIMEGTVLQETRGMVKMHLHGSGKPTVTCRCCGKELTNPISRHYGIGPVCLEKMGIHREIDDIESIREELVNIEWEGWVIKSAITEKEEI